MLLITLGPLLFMLLAFVLAGLGPSAGETPGLLVRILAAGITTALLYASLSMAVSSFTTRRAAAAVGVVLLLFVPASVVRSAIESAGAPDELDLLSSPFVAADLAYRIFGETARGRRRRSTELSTWLVAGGRGCGHPGRRARLLAPLPPPGGVPVTAEPRVVAENVSKWFGRARRRLRRQLRRRARRDGAARPERRRQVDDVPHALRARAAVQGHASACSAAIPARTRASPG